MNHGMVRVKWLEWVARDAMGSEWLQVFGSVEDLPEIVHIESGLKPSRIKAYLEGRYGYRVGSWSYCATNAEAASLVDSLYSGDPV